MFGIKEIINKIIYHTPIALEEKFKMLSPKRIDIDVIRYLSDLLKGLHIEVLGDYHGNIFELMHGGYLEGWCWQTTESAIIFFQDDDYIERGNLKFTDDSEDYYHSWICFRYHDEEYVFDSCLDILCKKEDYYHAFAVELKGFVLAKDVKEELLRQINDPKEEHPEDDVTACFFKRYLGDYYLEYQRHLDGLTIMRGPEDVNTPFYRSGAGYKVEMEKGQIKKLVAHYYYN